MMNQRIEELFHAACTRPQAERKKFLREACGDDAASLAAVESLLGSVAASTDFLEMPAAKWVIDGSDLGALRQTGSRIGRYQILRVLATGGMGIVYEAQQASPSRLVALKLMRRGLESEAAVRRFRRESELLGKLSHSNIAQVFEAGVETAAGESLPYIAMELLTGALPLTAYAGAKKLGIRERIELLCAVCEAVDYCHHQGVVHRDLKPGNILVTQDGRPKVIDFGVAMLRSQQERHTTWQTTGTPFVGSLPYMSPEQVGGLPGAVDAQSDVYALGVIAFEMLSGTLPVEVSGLPPLEAARRIRDDIPTPLGQLERRLGGDLETIVATAMAKDKRRRYTSARALCDDFRRFLASKPILARPPSRWYLFTMFARRHRAFLALGSAAAMILLSASVISTIFAVNARRQRAIARTAESAALAQSHSASYQAYVANIAAADAALRMHDVAEARRRLDRAPESFRNWEWRYLHGSLDRSRTTLRGHEGIVQAMSFSPDGDWLATGAGGWGYHDASVRLWDVESATEIRRLEGHARGITVLAFHPRNRQILASGSDDHTILVWDLDRSQPRAKLSQEGEVRDFGFTQDGEFLASLDSAGMVRLWHVATGQETSSFDLSYERQCDCMGLNPGNNQVVCGGRDGALRLFDVRSGKSLGVMKGHAAAIKSVAVSPDGELIASASDDLTVRVWNARAAFEWLTLRGHTASVVGVVFAPGTAGERLLASASHDNTVRLWRIGDLREELRGEPVAILHGHDASPTKVHFSPDATLLASGSEDKTAKIWDLNGIQEPALLRGHTGLVRTVAFSPDSRWLASGAFDGSIRIWDAAERKMAQTLDARAERVQMIAFHPDAGEMAAGCSDGVVRLWDTRHWAEIAALPAGDKAVHAVAYSPDGRFVSAGGVNGVLHTWDARTREEVQAIDLQSDWIETLAYTAQAGDMLLAVGCRFGRIHIVDPRTESAIRSFRTKDENMTMVCWAPDASAVASTYLDGTIRMWDPVTGAERGRLVGHSAIVNSIAFSPDGARLVSSANDTTVRIWDASTGDALLTLRHHTNWVMGASFSPDGLLIASAGGSYEGSDCAIRLWQAPPWKENPEP